MGALEAPQDKYGQEHRTGTSRVEQTDRDHGGAGSSGSHGGAGSSGGHGGAGSSGSHGGAGSSGGHGGAGSSGGHGGAGSSGGHGGAGSSGPLGPAPTAGTHTTPPQNFPGEVRGYQEPSGAKQTGQTGQGSPPGPDRQDSTKQERPPGPDRQDRTAHRNQKPSWARLEAEASSGHDQESEAHTGSLSNRFHIYDMGAGG